jgi:hypothetical protein
MLLNLKTFIQKYFFQSLGFIIVFVLASILLFRADGSPGQVFDSFNLFYGKLYVNLPSGIFYDDKYYTIQNPFPQVVFFPFILLMQITRNPDFWKLGQIFLIALVVYLTFKLIKTKYKENNLSDRLWFLLAFLGSSVVFNLYTMPGYLSHPVTTILLLLALIEYFNKKRLYLIGLYFSFIILSRPEAVLGLIFFIFSEIAFIYQDLKLKGIFKKYSFKEALKLLFEKVKLKKIIKVVFKLSILPLIGLILLSSFNYSRYHETSMLSAYEKTGVMAFYTRNKNSEYKIFYYQDLKDTPIFGTKYIPGNLYFMLIHPGYYVRDESYKNSYTEDPLKNLAISYINEKNFFKFKAPYLSIASKNEVSNKGNGMGIGILVGTPYLIYLFFSQYKRKEDIFLILAIIPNIVFLSVCSFPGSTQYSYRFTLDFFPFLFLLFLNQVKDKFTLNFKVIIFLMTLFNVWMVIGNYF